MKACHCFFRGLYKPIDALTNNMLSQFEDPNATAMFGT